MSHFSRVSVQRLRLRESNEGSAEKAPSALRNRVLAGVRSRPRSAPSLSAKAMLIVGALVLALPAASLLAIDRSSPRRVAGASAAAHVQLHRFGGHGELQIAGMAEPPIGEVYELWLLRRSDHTLQPTDVLFTVTDEGNATVDIPGDLRGAGEAMVTAEPLGGSPAPTSAAVLHVSWGASA